MGVRVATPSFSSKAQGAALSGSRTAAVFSTSACGCWPTVISTDTVMSGRKKMGGLGTASRTSTVPRLASTWGLIQSSRASKGWVG